MLLFKTSLDNRKRFTIHWIIYILYIYENKNENENENVIPRQIQNLKVKLKNI